MTNFIFKGELKDCVPKESSDRAINSLSDDKYKAGSPYKTLTFIFKIDF